MIDEKKFFELVYKANKFFKHDDFCRLTAYDGIAFAFHFYEEEFVKSRRELVKWMKKFDNSTLNGVLEHIPFVGCTEKGITRRFLECPLRLAMEQILSTKRELTLQRLEDLFLALEITAQKRFPVSNALGTKEIIAETGSSEDGFFVFLAGGTYDASKSTTRRDPAIHRRAEGIVRYEPGIYFVYDYCGLFNNEPWLSPKQKVDLKTLLRHMQEGYSQRHFVEEAELILKSADFKSKSTRTKGKILKENIKKLWDIGRVCTKNLDRFSKKNCQTLFRVC